MPNWLLVVIAGAAKLPADERWRQNKNGVAYFVFSVGFSLTELDELCLKFIKLSFGSFCRSFHRQ